MVEEADERWRILLLNQIDRSVTELIRYTYIGIHFLPQTTIFLTVIYRLEVLPAENGDGVKKELEKVLLKEFDREFADRLQDEIRLIRIAKSELKDLEQQLSKPSQIQYYSGKYIIATLYAFICPQTFSCLQMTRKCLKWNFRSGTTSRPKRKKF